VTDATSAPTLVFDVEEADFQTAVLDRSHEVPVVVDFWAAWCGPCRTLGPMLESAVAARGGEVVLAKVDVDKNQALAQAFRVQGIPQVLGFRDGKVVTQFTGVVPAPQLDAFFDELAPSEADRAVALARTLDGEAREVELRRALELDPAHREGAVALGGLLAERDPQAALELVAPHRPDPAAEAVVTRAELARGGGGDVDELRAAADRGDASDDTLLDLGRALAARGEYDEAIERLLAAVELGGDTRDPAREQLVALFGMLGDDDERVRTARPRLARALF
jgi:putative thioredoxin